VEQRADAPEGGAPAARERASEVRRRTYGAALGVVGLVNLLRLVLMLRRGGSGAFVWVVAVAVVVAVVVVTLVVMVRRVPGLAEHVVRQRTGALVIPAVTAGEMSDLSSRGRGMGRGRRRGARREAGLPPAASPGSCRKDGPRALSA